MATREGEGVPSAPEAEAAVVGIGLSDVERLRIAGAIVSPAEFYVPSLAAVYAAMLTLDARGEAVDPVSVWTLLDGSVRDTVGANGLTKLMVDAPPWTSMATHARLIVERAAGRRLLGIAGQMAIDARGLNLAADVIDRTRAALDDVPLVEFDGVPPGALSGDSWLEVDLNETTPWVIKGMLRTTTRAVMVADPGAGKSWLTTQMAVCAAQGIHPFWPTTRIRPINTLVVDAENPHDAIDARIGRMISKARSIMGEDYREHAFWLWSRPGGMNLRARTDRAQLEALLRHVRPSLVVIGPLYKSFRKRPNEDHEDAATDVQNILDDLRTRYQFALVLEAHGPHGELRVRGSSAWGGWPEIGHGLRREPSGNLTVVPFRQDRTGGWPDEYHRGGPGEWPWVGKWTEGDSPTGQESFG